MTDSPNPSDGTMIIEAGEIRVGDMLDAQDFRAEVPVEVIRLFQDSSVRRAASNVMSPLQRDGIDRMHVRQGDEEPESFTSDDVRAFVVPPEENVLGQTIS